ncbi:SAM-dependent methyltransferase [Streptomyces griseocarneus]|nr:SAM-dependent methyltransferase [Streptomyces griseocarneus]
MSGDEGRDYDGYARLGLDRSGQAEAFDSIGDLYDDAFPHKEGQLAAGAWLASTLPPGSRVLDLGCGTGLPTARQLSDAGHEVVGVDLSPGMLELARGNVPEAEFVRADLADLRDGRLGTFDGVAAFFSLLMLPRAEIPYALRMTHGLLRPGGLLALAMVEADVDDFAMPFLGHTIRVSGYLREELRQVVCESGFDVVGESTQAYAPASTDVPPEIQLFFNLRRA